MATVFRTIKSTENPFVMMDKRPINDKDLSWSAKGLLAYLLSKPDDWKVIIENLVNQSVDGRDKVYSIVDELIDAGYIVKRSYRDKGKFQTEYSVYENRSGKTVPVEPIRLDQSGKTDTTNNDILIQNTDISGTDVPDQFPLEWKIQAGKAVTSLPKEDNEMLKVSEVISKSFKDDYKLAVDILMAFQKTRGITFLYEDQKKHKKALATLIKSGVKPEHVVTATKELMKAKYTVTDLFSISKTAINLANPMPAENKPKKYVTAYEE